MQLAFRHGLLARAEHAGVGKREDEQVRFERMHTSMVVTAN